MILGIDIGGTNIKTALVYDNNESVDFKYYSKTPTLAKKRQGEGILKKVLEIVSEYQLKFAITGVAISTAGVVSGQTFEILYANENIPYYKGINFSTEIMNTFGLPCVVENDVNAATLGEWKYGAGKEGSSILCLTVGTGIGGGLILENNLYRGFSYCAAEIGYMKLGDSTFENLASTQQLIKRVKSKKNDSQIDGEEIFRLAKDGDEDCQKAIQELIKQLCLGISNCVYLVNPEKVILGGGIMEQKEYLLPRIQREFEQIFSNRIGKPEILVASLGNSACLAGVYWLFNSLYGKNKL